MVDAFKAIVVLVLIIIGFIVYPAARIADRSDDVARHAASSAVEEFADTVRGKGYIAARDYETLRARLDGTGLVFEVQLEHYRRTIQPVYSDPNNSSTFQNRYTIEYVGSFSKDILDRIYPTPGTFEASRPADDLVRRYPMHAGDLLQVRVQSRGTTLGSRLQGMLFGQTAEVPILAAAGGMVRSEAP